jgi:hypothetical protein
MGALATATLAGVHIHGALYPVPLAGMVRSVTIVTWVLATLWIPPLDYVGWRRIRDWPAVSPLGVYSAATFAMAVETGVGALNHRLVVFFWVAFAVWLLVAIPVSLAISVRLRSPSDVFAIRRLARTNRTLDVGDDAVRVLGEVQPGEVKHLPAQQRDGILSHPVILEVLRVAVLGQAVDLDRDLAGRKRNVDAVSADGVVRLPARDARGLQQLDEQSFGLRSGTTVGLEEPPGGGRAVPTLVSEVCVPERPEFDVALQRRVQQLGTAAPSDRGFNHG